LTLSRGWTGAPFASLAPSGNLLFASVYQHAPAWTVWFAGALCFGFLGAFWELAFVSVYQHAAVRGSSYFLWLAAKKVTKESSLSI
jgi:hypothetical protein